MFVHAFANATYYYSETGTNEIMTGTFDCTACRGVMALMKSYANASYSKQAENIRNDRRSTTKHNHGQACPGNISSHILGHVQRREGRSREEKSDDEKSLARPVETFRSGNERVPRSAASADRVDCDCAARGRARGKRSCAHPSVSRAASIHR